MNILKTRILTPLLLVAAHSVSPSSYGQSTEEQTRDADEAIDENLSVGVDNLTNEITYVYHPWPGRTVYANVGYRF